MTKENTLGYLYRHIRVDKDEVFYVGIGTIKNYARAYNKVKRNPFRFNVTNKTKYIVEIIMDNVPYSKLLEKETEFIKLYGRRNINTGTLVNLTDGGEGVLGCVKPHKGKGKTWEDICKNPEQVRINRENRSQPYIISIKEPDKDIYDVRCENILDFNRKLKLNSKYLLGVLKCGNSMVIQRVRNNSRHNFPVGTILTFSKIDREKQIFNYPNPITGDRRRPFTVTVKEPDGKTYDIFCEDHKDFFKKIRHDSKTISLLKDNRSVFIQKVRIGTVHPFPTGTELRLKSTD